MSFETKYADLYLFQTSFENHRKVKHNIKIKIKYIWL